MCPRMDWFVTYESVDTGVVFMGNDVIGTVQIKTHDGRLKPMMASLDCLKFITYLI